MAEPNASVNNTVPEDPVHDELSQFLNEPKPVSKSVPNTVAPIKAPRLALQRQPKSYDFSTIDINFRLTFD